MELNPLMTSPGIQTDLYLYVIHVDLIQPFCRFQLNIQRTACCFELHVLAWFVVDFYHKCKNLDSGYSSFETAKLVNT